MRMPNGYGGVTRLKGTRRKPYAARVTAGWTDTGKQKTRYIGYYASRAEALQALAAYNAAPHDIDARRMTLDEAYHGWADRKLAKASDATIASHKSAWAHLAPLHGRQMTELSVDAMQTLLDSMEQKYSASMLRNVRRLLIYSFKHAMERDVVAKNYADFLRVDKSSDSDMHRPFALAHVHRVLDAARGGDEAARLVAILLYTGMRIEEMLKMQTANIDLDARIMVGGNKTAAGRNRRIPIHRDILPYIAERIGGGRFLVMGLRGTTAMSRTVFRASYWLPLIERLGLDDYKPHDTRATFISRMDGTGANDVSVKMIVGHGFGGDVTKARYTFKTDAELLAAMDALSW